MCTMCRERTVCRLEYRRQLGQVLLDGAVELGTENDGHLALEEIARERRRRLKGTQSAAISRSALSKNEAWGLSSCSCSGQVRSSVGCAAARLFLVWRVAVRRHGGHGSGPRAAMGFFSFPMHRARTTAGRFRLCRQGDALVSQIAPCLLKVLLFVVGGQVRRGGRG